MIRVNYFRDYVLGISTGAALLHIETTDIEMHFTQVTRTACMDSADAISKILLNREELR